MPANHRKVMRAIQDCRSGACGHHLFACPDCGQSHVAKSSCGNRHCPVCQHDKSALWVYKQQLKSLPCTTFFATFTVPEELRAVARANQRVIYDAMFKEAAASLNTLEADPRFVGCKVSGFFGVLHTWTRQLQYHPHVHFVIPGGGLDASRTKWVASKGHFLVHVRALSAMFRGKMKAALRREGLLDHVAPEVWNKDWVVHCKPAGDGRAVLKYLGAYIFRVAISDSRIVRYDGENVTFKYQEVGASKWKIQKVAVHEFMRRYLQHVLPHGFMKVRHYGFLSHNFGLPIERVRELISMLYEAFAELLPKLEKPQKKPMLCSACKTEMRWLLYLPPAWAPSASPP